MIDKIYGERFDLGISPWLMVHSEFDRKQILPETNTKHKPVIRDARSQPLWIMSRQK